MRARSRVSPIACHSRPVRAWSHRLERVTPGPGRTSFFQPERWISSQMIHTRPIAATFGRTVLAMRAARSRPSAPGRSSPRSSASRPARVVSAAMAAYLLAEPVGDDAGQLGDRGGVDPPRPFDGNRVLLDHPAWPARQQDDAVAQADRLADVVGDEQDGEPPANPLADPVELVVEQVAGHRVERAERL